MTTGDIEIQALLKEIDRYKKAFEDVKTEIDEVRKNALGFPNWEYAKGLETAWNIIDKHNLDKVGKESGNV